MNNFGFIKVAAAIPSVSVADCDHNSENIITMMHGAAECGVRVVLFPELSITGCSCGDLVQQPVFLRAAERALKRIVVASHDINTAAIVGVPVAVGDKIYNCAAVIACGEILGLVPKCHLANYGDAAESRWFNSGINCNETIAIEYAGENVAFGWEQLFEVDGVKFGIEFAEELNMTSAPSNFMAHCGATLIFTPAATPEIVGRHAEIKAQMEGISSQQIAARIYSSAGFGESTTDVVYAGNAFIAENGKTIKESERFSIEQQMIKADIDVEMLQHLRRQRNTFDAYADDTQLVQSIKLAPAQDYIAVDRDIDPMPFVPSEPAQRKEFCKEVFSIQTLGLMKRLKHTSCRSAVIGISGGLDSTLALLVAVNAFDRLGLDRKGIVGVTMPGFGTTDRTYNNAVTLIKELGITFREISIAAACRQHFADIGLQEGDHSVTFENAQARERTQILMDVANMTGGMVIGTGDMSELALGWATYNGDQMSMYGVNCNIAKTLVRHIVLWAADKETNQNVSRALKDVVDTPVSPELLPANDNGDIAQKTEDLVGPYELHDFFLYNFLKNGFSPAKILFLAQRAFNEKYDRETILKWLKTFFRRFFTQQFKRSASPDGVKVCSIGLSPRGDLRMPSDASAKVWISECDKLQ